MSWSLEPLLRALQGWPPELVWFLELIAAFSGVLVLHRYFGAAGLYTFIVVAIIGANIEVLKAVKFGVYEHPVAMGTILFASSYLATDILAERYGPKAARKGIWLGFSALLLFNILMLLNLGFRPLTVGDVSSDTEWMLGMQAHLEAIFLPGPGFFLAGMCAYLTSQYHDVWLFEKLRSKTGGKLLWLRNNLSTAISALIDNTIFSILAWVVFTADPQPWSAVVFTYILGTYWLRLGVAVLDTPFVYLARIWLPKEEVLPRESA